VTKKRLVSALLLSVLALAGSHALACPFCTGDPNAVGLQTLIERADNAALVRPVGDVPDFNEMLRTR
jgi:hypothetical protein